MNQKIHPVYKGLQKPLVYKNFKGKYIYYAVASVIGGILTGGLVGAFTNMILGCICILIIMSSGMLYTISKQKKGLFDKTHRTGIFIYPSKFSHEKRK